MYLSTGLKKRLFQLQGWKVLGLSSCFTATFSGILICLCFDTLLSRLPFMRRSVRWHIHWVIAAVRIGGCVKMLSGDIHPISPSKLLFSGGDQARGRWRLSTESARGSLFLLVFLSSAFLSISSRRLHNLRPKLLPNLLTFPIAHARRRFSQVNNPSGPDSFYIRRNFAPLIVFEKTFIPMCEDDSKWSIQHICQSFVLLSFTQFEICQIHGDYTKLQIREITLEIAKTRNKSINPRVN